MGSSEHPSNRLEPVIWAFSGSVSSLPFQQAFHERVLQGLKLISATFIYRQDYGELMKPVSIFFPIFLLTSSLIGCLGGDGDTYDPIPIWYKVNCECDTLYVEYTTSDDGDFVYGYVTPDVNGDWVSNEYIFNAGDDIWTELILYAADEDANNQYRETITATIMFDSVVFESLSRTEVMPDVEVKANI